MRTTGHSFGRLDLLRDKDGLWFLELNPNGQFAWLDVDGSGGLLKAVAAELMAGVPQNKSGWIAGDTRLTFLIASRDKIHLAAC